MAAVYEATHRNRMRVAVKLLHPILSLDEGTRHRFLREGYVANTIRHEGAVQVLDDDLTEEGIAFLVMELLEGETVEDRMDRKGGALDIAEALHIVEELLDVLCAAHDQGVIHRDIKPDNLFLTDDGRLKVLDFGIARLHQGDSRATKVGSFMGTPAYCAPEQARGRWDEVDARTDLFSVAATLFTMITGSHVHPAETSSEQLALAIGATARSLRDALPGAPDELVQCVDRALSYDKDDRFQSARAMKAAVQKVRAGLGDVKLSPSARPSSVRPPVSRLAQELGSHTLGGDDDSQLHDVAGLASLYPVQPRARLLVGILAAGVLAAFILVAAGSADQSRVQTERDSNAGEAHGDPSGGSAACCVRTSASDRRHDWQRAVGANRGHRSIGVHYSGIAWRHGV
jgi:serine/threonine-protein kinase